jgi:hypothetical protein
MLEFSNIFCGTETEYVIQSSRFFTTLKPDWLIVAKERRWSVWVWYACVKPVQLKEHAARLQVDCRNRKKTVRRRVEQG